MHVSLAALERMHEVLSQLSAATDTIHQAVQADIANRLSRLEARIDSAEDEVRRLRQELDYCDDEDTDGLSSSLADEEERLARLRFHVDQVSDTLGPFRRLSAELDTTLRAGLPRATVFLERKMQEVAEYVALSADTFGTNQQGSRSGTEAHASTHAPSKHQPSQVLEAAPIGDFEQLSQMPLPSGFQWVQLSEISASDDLRPDEGFPKVSEAEMSRGLFHLMTVVTPALARNRGTGSDHFRLHDQEQRLEYHDGTLRAYEAFFGNDAIVITRQPGSSLYGVTNGRHRIHVARKNGWVALPVRVV
jgi:hypothetical protein